MRLNTYRWVTLAALVSACAEPTGTESGNPSQPGARAPSPHPLPAPPLPHMPIQPAPHNEHELPASETGDLPNAPAQDSADSTTEEGVPTHATTGGGTSSVPIAETVDQTIEGHEGAPKPAEQVPNSVSSPMDEVDAGDAGVADASP